MSMPTKSQSMSEDLPMSVTENPDGSFTIEWDENHHITSVFNTWTEKDFLDAIESGCRVTLGQEEYDRIKEEYSDQEPNGQ